MKYAFPALDTSTQGQVYDVPVPMSKYLEASFDEGVHYTVLNSLNRMSEMSLADTDDSPMLTAEQANKDWAVGDMKFTGPTRTSIARIMNRRKREEMDRNFFLSNGASKSRFLPGMAASMIGSITNPLDLGLMFVPFVGTEAAVAKATTPMGKMLARRLVTREVLKDTFPRAPMLTESVINGMVGQTLFEVPAVIASAQDMSDYGPAQSLMNIAAGGTFAAGLHGLARLVQRLGNGTKVEMARQALTQVLRDEPVRVHELVKIDEHALWEKIRFDENDASAKAYSAVDRDKIATDIHTKAGPKVNTDTPAAFIAADGSTEVGYAHFGDKLQAFVTKHGEDNVERAYHLTDGRIISEKEMSALTGVPVDELSSEYLLHGIENNMAPWEESHFIELQENGMTRGAAAREILSIRNDRAKTAFFKNPDNAAKLDAEYKKEIDNYIAKERERFEQEKQGRFDKLKQQEIEAQIKAGKTLTPEEVQKAIPAAKFADMAEGDLDADIAALKKQQGIEEKPAGEAGKKEEQQGLVAGAIKGIDAAIKSLDHDPTKMSLPLADLLTLGIGRPVLKGLLMAVKEGLILFNDLAKAIDHALSKNKEHDTPEVRSALMQVATPESKLFTYAIQTELGKSAPFGIKAERFTPQVIVARLKNLPQPEQAMLKMAGLDEFMAKYKPTEMVDRAAFEKFVDSAMIEPEIRPMLNVSRAGGDNPASRKYQQLRHELETVGYRFGDLEADSGPDILKAPTNPQIEIQQKLDQFKLLHDQLNSDFGKRQGTSFEDQLIGDFVSQNVSVPIAFDKMEKPRTIFLAADQVPHVGSSHYTEVKFGEKLPYTAKASDKQYIGNWGVFEDDKLFFFAGPGSLNTEAHHLRIAHGNPKRSVRKIGVGDDLSKFLGRNLRENRSMLAWMETHIVTMPDGRKVLHVFEAQSDVRQSFYLDSDDYLTPSGAAEHVANYIDGKGENKSQSFLTKKEAETFLDQKLKEYQEKVQPLIDHTDEILMKAALQLAKREGLDGVVISDPRTAMLTQGHVGSMDVPTESIVRSDIEDEMGRFTERATGPGVYEPPSQAAGMTQAYGQKLPSLMKRFTGKEGEAVELGGKHYLREIADSEDGGPGGASDVRVDSEFDKAFPGSDSPSGQFFPVKDLAPNKPFETIGKNQVEPPKPQLDAIKAAVDCILQKVI